MNKVEMHRDPFIGKMIEEIYEDESSRKNWDCSFIESVRNQYYEKGITEKQLSIVEVRYGKLKSPMGERKSYDY